MNINLCYGIKQASYDKMSTVQGNTTKLKRQVFFSYTVIVHVLLQRNMYALYLNLPQYNYRQKYFVI